MLDTTSLWQCPVCESPIEITERKWQCKNQHSYDIAKEGYVNLLLPQHKNSKSPGDSKEMVLARRNFLSQGHYAPLAKSVSDLLLTTLSDETFTSSKLSIFDAGCGEGYYLNMIASRLREHQQSKKDYIFCGVDIAKPAVQKASKKSRAHNQGLFQFAVASSFNVPLLTESQHAVLQIFAPSKPEEIRRILAPNGLWVLVNPACDHLFELKNMVYDTPQKHESTNVNIEGFSVVSSQTLKFEIQLNTAQQRQNLLMMTPFYWTISQEKKQLLLTELVRTHAHFDIQVLRKI